MSFYFKDTDCRVNRAAHLKQVAEYYKLLKNLIRGPTEES